MFGEFTSLLALLFAGQSSAAAASCAVPMPLPPALSAWAGEGRATPPGGSIALGRVARLGLVNRRQAGFVVAPGREAPRATNGGVFAFEVRRAGAYRVALSERAWIDVATENEIVDSVGHEHGPACSGIAKIVDFALTPGSYSLQISGIGATTVKAMVIERR